MKIKIKIFEMIGSWEPYSAASHGVAAVASFFCALVMAYFAGKHGTLLEFIATGVFMTSMVALYMASAVYHLFPLLGKWKLMFRRVDHGMIYVLIAGTYTPLCMIALKNHGGWMLLAIMWGVAFAGIILKIRGVDLSNFWQTAIYLGMGVVGGFKIPTLLDVFGEAGVFWFVGGGIIYILGAFCYLIESYWDPDEKYYFHEGFHILVMAGSGFHYWLMLRYLLLLN